MGGDLYWIVTGPYPFADNGTTVKRAPSQGGPASTIAELSFNGYSLGGLGVTRTALFFCFGTEFTSPVVWFPLVAGTTDAGATGIGGQCLSRFLSDTDAVYFESTLPTILRMASDATPTVPGQAYTGIDAIPSAPVTAGRDR